MVAFPHGFETPKSLLDQARTAKKERRLEEAAELFRRGLTESLNMRATLFEELAYVERNLRDQESSQEYYRQAGEIYRSLGNPLKMRFGTRRISCASKRGWTRRSVVCRVA